MSLTHEEVLRVVKIFPSLSSMIISPLVVPIMIKFMGSDKYGAITSMLVLVNSHLTSLHLIYILLIFESYNAIN